MKVSAISLSFVLLCTSLLSYSMEIVVPCKKRITTDEINRYKDEICDSTKFLEISDRFRGLSNDKRRKILRRMSPNLLLLHGVTTLLPKEVVKNHILVFLLDGYEKAAGKFCNKSIGEAFFRHHTIGNSIGDKPMWPLYRLKKKDLKPVLEVINLCNSFFPPVVTAQKKEEIDRLFSNEIQRNYIKGKRIIVLPDDYDNRCTLKEIGLRVASMTCLGSAISAILIVLANLSGDSVFIDNAIAYDAFSAPIQIGFMTGVLSAWLEGTRSLLGFSQIVTL